MEEEEREGGMRGRGREEEEREGGKEGERNGGGGKGGGGNERERKGDLVAFFLAFASHICNIIISLSDLHQCKHQC